MADPTAAMRRTVLAALACEGIAQAELARRCGVSAKHVNQTLRGHAGLSVSLAGRMLAAVGWRLVIGAHPEVDRD